MTDVLANMCASTGPNYGKHGDGEQITGLALTGIFVVGYFFASPWPRKTAWFQKLMCLRPVNDFAVFYITHLTLTISAIVLLVFHPIPGLVNTMHKSTTWQYMAAGVMVYFSGNLIQYFRHGAAQHIHTD